MINVVVCFYAFEERDGQLYGLPYHISLRPIAAKNGHPACVNVSLVRKIDLTRLREGDPMYIGFNPFQNAFGVYSVNSPFEFIESINIPSDAIGFVYQTYLLASNFNREDVCHPAGFGAVFQENRSIASEYNNFRLKKYFKWFNNTKPVKIWGCDSPIELFLLQAMQSLNLKPKIQTYIFPDGTIFPHLHAMWLGNKKGKNRNNLITEADFYFEAERLAVFCDSKKHHSDPKAKEKDRKIDEKLKTIGIDSIRIPGTEIAASPLACAHKIQSYINNKIK